jgi:DNA repair exonuclease SbcCD ATPase subunit
VRTMLLTKVKVVTAVVLGLALVGGSGTMLGYGRVVGQSAAVAGDVVPGAQVGRATPPGEEKLKASLAKSKIVDLKIEIDTAKANLDTFERDLQQLKESKGEDQSRLDLESRCAEYRATLKNKQALLDQLEKEQEISDLKARIGALEQESREKTLRLEKVMREAQAQAERALDAEQQARQQALEERAVRKRAEEKAAVSNDKSGAGLGRVGGGEPMRPASAEGLPTSVVEQARDEVELLEVQLQAKKAQEKAAKLTLQAMTDMASVTVPDLKQRIELATLTGQVEVKAAEVKESEVRLAQAKRRLARLQGSGEPAPDPQRQQLDQKAKELETKIGALQKELESLRKDLERQRPARP